MVDGWNWRIEKYIVVIDHITLWSDPNQSPSDQSQHGPQVAHVDGPFVVDLHKGGPIDGKGGAAKQALAIAALTNQNDNGGAAFDPSTTYGFGFSTVQAPGRRQRDQREPRSPTSRPTTSTWCSRAATASTTTGRRRGPATPSGRRRASRSATQTCANASVERRTADAATRAASADAGAAVPRAYDFTQLPQTMTFQLGFSTPTNYVNCVNYTRQRSWTNADGPRRADLDEPERRSSRSRSTWITRSGRASRRTRRALGPDRGAVHRS